VPPPGAEDWFHVSVVVDYPNIKVYVNDEEKPCLEVNQISTTQEGKLGLWLGNNSNGWFKNIRIYPADYRIQQLNPYFKIGAIPLIWVFR